MQRTHSKRKDGTSQRKVKKVRSLPATPDELLQIVNIVRGSMNVKDIKQDMITKQLALEYLNGERDLAKYYSDDVILSCLALKELWDGKSSSSDIVNRWLDDPGKCPVLFAPGDQGFLDVLEKDGKEYLVMIVMSVFQ